METRRHIEEMTRFANSEEGTRVWYRPKIGTNWYTIAHPTWDKNCLYVVDDEDAELRKESADSKNYKVKQDEY